LSIINKTDKIFKTILFGENFMSNVLNQEALTANREGHLAPGQYFKLLPYILGSGFIFILGASLLLGMLYNLYSALVNHIIENGTYVGIPLFGALGAWLAWFGVSSSRRTILDLIGGKVISIDGPTSKHRQPSRNGRGSILYYSVGTLSFQIPASWTWENLPEGDSARAYYTPNSKTFVNVELLSAKHK
jgi:hypothetical protein